MTKDVDGPEAAPPALRHELEAPKVTDQLYQAFPNNPTMYGTDPKDGMPRPVSLNTLKDSEVPDLDSVENLVCMADTSKFLRRDKQWGDVLSEHEPSEVERAPDGRYRLKVVPSREPLLQKVKPFRPERIEVQPIRPQCMYYARQLVPFPEDTTKKFMARLCTARRTDEGEFLSVNDTHVYACELRMPRFGNASERLDQADLEAIEKKKKSTVPDDFDVERALEQERTQ